MQHLLACRVMLRKQTVASPRMQLLHVPPQRVTAAVTQLAEPYDAANGSRRFQLLQPVSWANDAQRGGRASAERRAQVLALIGFDPEMPTPDQTDLLSAVPLRCTALLSELLVTAWRDRYDAFELHAGAVLRQQPLTLREFAARLRFGDGLSYAGATYVAGHVLPTGVAGFSALNLPPKTPAVSRAAAALKLLDGSAGVPERELLYALRDIMIAPVICPGTAAVCERAVVVHHCGWLAPDMADSPLSYWAERPPVFDVDAAHRQTNTISVLAVAPDCFDPSSPAGVCVAAALLLRSSSTRRSQAVADSAAPTLQSQGVVQLIARDGTAACSSRAAVAVVTWHPPTELITRPALCGAPSSCVSEFALRSAEDYRIRRASLQRIAERVVSRRRDVAAALALCTPLSVELQDLCAVYLPHFDAD